MFAPYPFKQKGARVSFKRRIITTVTTIALSSMTLFPSPAIADPMQELESARQMLSTYGQQLAEVQTRLSQNTEKLNVIESDIVARRADADQTNLQLEDAQNALASHMRDNYRAGSSSLLSVLVNSESFESLVSRVYIMDKINEQSSQEIANVRDLQNSLAEQLTMLEAQKQQQVETLEATQREAQAYTQRVNEAAAYYNTLGNEVRAQLTAEARQRLSAANGQNRAVQLNQNGVVTDGITNALSLVDPNGMVVEGAQNPVDDPSNPELTIIEQAPIIGVPSGAYVPSYTGDDARMAIVDRAISCLGVPYVWGGKSMAGFDCSGLTTYCYEQSGVDVGGNRTTGALISWMQSRGTWRTSLSELMPGDMLFPSTGHVAIYLGDGLMIHAPYPGDVVRIASVYSFIGGGWAG